MLVNINPLKVTDVSKINPVLCQAVRPDQKQSALNELV